MLSVALVSHSESNDFVFESLFLEYARVMSLDRDAMNYREDGEYFDDDEL